MPGSAPAPHEAPTARDRRRSASRGSRYSSPGVGLSSGRRSSSSSGSPRRRWCQRRHRQGDLGCLCRDRVRDRGLQPPGTSWEGITDANGRFRLIRGYGVNTVLGKDGRVRGRVVFTGGTFLVFRSPGYREKTIYLEGRFPQGIDFDDTSPRTIRVPLFPSRAR